MAETDRYANGECKPCVKARHAAYRAGIPDKYVENIIYKNNKLLKQVQIPPEMIEAKRVEIKLKRLIKEMKK